MVVEITLAEQLQSSVKRSSSLSRIPLLVRLSILVLALLVMAAIMAPWLAPYSHTAQNLRARLSPPSLIDPSSQFLLGTDQLGRDILSRTLIALRTSLSLAGMGMAIGLAVGTTLGLVSGLARGFVDHLIMFLVDTQIALPFTLVALTAIAVFGTSPAVLVVVIGLAGWDTYARLTRGIVLSLREKDFVDAARALGVSKWRIAVRYILPNMASPLIVLATFRFSSLVLLESSLSFLGLGIQPPNVSLGLLISSGRDYLLTAWWIAVAPSVVLVSITLCFSLFGDWLRDVLDPKLR